MIFNRKSLLVLLLCILSVFTNAQSIKRQVISFYGNTTNSLKATAGQLVSGVLSDSSNSFIQGFQQPLENKLDVFLNVKNDTILCEFDTLILKTGKGYRYRWFRNDTLIQNNSGNSLVIKKEGVYKLVGYDGISKYDTGKTIRVTYMQSPSRPIIAGFRKDTLFCFNDTLLLKSLNTYDKYIWSTGDTARTINGTSSGAIYLKVGKRIPMTNNYCFSANSDTISIQKNITPIPRISRIGDDLVSTKSNFYRWYYNYRLEPFDSVNQVNIKYKGSYYVTTSIDGKCWSYSGIYLVQSDPISSLQKDYKIVAFPNPFIGQFYLQFSLDRRYSGKIQLSISDASGIVKWSSSKFIYDERTFKIPVNVSLAKGIYTVQIVINGYKRKSIQIIRM